jgi:hypothetical protein
MSSDYGSNPEDKSDDDLLHELRIYCQKVLDDYESEIKTDVFFPAYILTNRLHRLRKLLFRDCEQILQDFTSIAITDRKELAIYHVDLVLRSALISQTQAHQQQLSSASGWRDVMNEMFEISNHDVELLSKMPLSNFTLIEQAISDIELHVRQVIRTIQLCHSQQGSATVLNILLDNRLDNNLLLDHTDASKDGEDDDRGLVFTGTEAPDNNNDKKPSKKRSNKRKVEDEVVEQVGEQDNEHGNDDLKKLSKSLLNKTSKSTAEKASTKATKKKKAT